jgi:hypothetical protein
LFKNLTKKYSYQELNEKNDQIFVTKTIDCITNRMELTRLRPAPAGLRRGTAGKAGRCGLTLSYKVFKVLRLAAHPRTLFATRGRIIECIERRLIPPERVPGMFLPVPTWACCRCAVDGVRSPTDNVPNWVEMVTGRLLREIPLQRD